MHQVKRFAGLGAGAALSNTIVPIAFRTVPFLASSVITRILSRIASIAVVGMAGKLASKFVNPQLLVDGASAAQFSPILNEGLAALKVPFRLGYGDDDDMTELGMFTDDNVQNTMGMLTDENQPLALEM